jgi:hypothetical protein
MRAFILASLAVLFLAPLGGGGARAVTAPRAYSEDAELSGLLYAAAAFFTSERAVPERSGWRSRSAGPSGAELSLRFEGADPWPRALERRWREGGGELFLSDRAPFGGARLRGPGGRAKEAEKIQELLSELEKGPRVGAAPCREALPGLCVSAVKAFWGIRMGPPELLVIRADPQRWSLRPWSERERESWRESPADIAGWRDRLPEAAALLTGPQYYDDRRSMGVLSREGRLLEGREHPRWKGWLAGDPASPGDKAFLVHDRAHSPDKGVEGGYRTLLQSFMLVDRLEGVRVKKSASLSSRLAAGEDKGGSIVVVYSEGASSLHDFAELLIALNLGPMIGLDGGLQSQLAIRRGSGWELRYGEYTHSYSGNIRMPCCHPTIPFVLALVPRDGPEPGPASR